MQLPSGAFCDAPVSPSSPFSICLAHQMKVARWINNPAFTASVLDDPRAQRRLVQREPKRDWVQPGPPSSHVYYVLLPHHLVKIGFSTKVRARLADLRVPRDALLAVEPGGRDLERALHNRFNHLLSRWREEFRPTQELQDHVAAVIAKHGAPWEALDSAGQGIV